METSTVVPVVLSVSNLVPPSGGSLEIGNLLKPFGSIADLIVPPSGGSLEIGNLCRYHSPKSFVLPKFPLRGDP